jgi:formylglycine-generating enzyme required for sulfatase activity
LSCRVPAFCLVIAPLAAVFFCTAQDALAQRPASGEMVFVKGGTFTMGSPASEPWRYNDEVRHGVTVASFHLGRCEVTQREWRELMGTTVRRRWDKENNYISVDGEGGDNFPMFAVNWYEAIKYCNRLSGREGLMPAYTVKGRG